MIERLELKNWKAIAERAILFQPGLNILVGPNGSGKTSIMEAIRLAFCGRVAVGDPSRMIHYAADQAEVTVVFRAGERRYQLARAVRRKGKGLAELSEVDGPSLGHG